MPNGVVQNINECEEEIAPLASDLKLNLRVEIYEDEAAEIGATRIIWGVEKYYVRAYWHLTGTLARHFCGKWQVKIDLESIGDAGEYTSDLVTYDMDPCKEDEYYHTFTLGPGDLDPHKGGTVYIPAVTLSTLDPCGGDGHMWAYCVGPSVMFIAAQPHD